MTAVPAGGQAAHPAILISAPFHNSSGMPIDVGSTSACSHARGGLTAWHAATGALTTSVSSSAKTCGKTLGTVGGANSGYFSAGVVLSFPFRVTSSGSHDITTQLSVNIASAWSYAVSSVSCSKSLNYHPGGNSSAYAYCEAGTYGSFQISAQLVDPTDPNWSSWNSSYAYLVNDTQFLNYTACFGRGTPTCTNTTGMYSANYGNGLNEAGLSRWNWNGANAFTLWSNATQMKKGHQYILMLELYATVSAFAEVAHLTSPWSASASAAINLGTFGNGAKLGSITVA